MFDDTAYQPHRLMHGSSVSMNEEFVFKELKRRTQRPRQNHWRKPGLLVAFLLQKFASPISIDATLMGMILFVARR